jgi:hypothetical protein
LSGNGLLSPFLQFNPCLFVSGTIDNYPLTLKIEKKELKEEDKGEVRRDNSLSFSHLLPLYYSFLKEKKPRSGANEQARGGLYLLCPAHQEPRSFFIIADFQRIPYSRSDCQYFH